MAARGHTVRDVLERVEAEHGELLRRIVDERGAVRDVVRIFIDDTDIRALEGLDSPVDAGSVVSIVPALSGGGHRSVAVPVRDTDERRDAVKSRLDTSPRWAY